MSCPDNYDAFDRHDAEQERAEKEWREKAPECSECGRPIMGEDCWVIGDAIFCEECIDGFRDYTKNHMEG